MKYSLYKMYKDLTGPNSFVINRFHAVSQAKCQKSNLRNIFKLIALLELINCLNKQIVYVA